MSKKTIAVLKGGRSLERNISLKSGARVEKALREQGYSVEGIDVDESLVNQLKDLKPDAAFIAMHGRSGEDGTVQELLDILNIPYTGSDVLPSIRCMDKVLSKHSFIADGIPTPPFYAFNRDAFQELGAVDTMPIIGKELGFPIVVKPAAQGSALGIRFAHTVSEMPAALISAFSFDNKVLLSKLKAEISAAGISLTVCAKRIPSAEPWAAGLTTIGKPSSLPIMGMVSTAPSSWNASRLK